MMWLVTQIILGQFTRGVMFGIFDLEIPEKKLCLIGSENCTLESILEVSMTNAGQKI